MTRMIKRLAAACMAMIITSTTILSASAYNYTVQNSYQKFYASSSETTTNYYVAYSSGKNKTSNSRYMVVTSRIVEKINGSTNVLDNNKSEGVTNSGITRSVEARAGTDSFYRSYHTSAIFNNTNPMDGTVSTYTKYFEYWWYYN